MNKRLESPFLRVICLVLALFMLLTLVLPIISIRDGFKNSVAYVNNEYGEFLFENNETILVCIFIECILEADLDTSLLESISQINIADYNLDELTEDELYDELMEIEGELATYEDVLEDSIEYAWDEMYWSDRLDVSVLSDVLSDVLSSHPFQSLLLEYLVYSYADMLVALEYTKQFDLGIEDTSKLLIKTAKALKDGKLTPIETFTVLKASALVTDLLVIDMDYDAQEIETIRENVENGTASPTEEKALSIIDVNNYLHSIKYIYLSLLCIYTLIIVGLVCATIFRKRTLGIVLGALCTIIPISVIVAIFIGSNSIDKAIIDFLREEISRSISYDSNDIHILSSTKWMLCNAFAGVATIILAFLNNRSIHNKKSSSGWVCSCGNNCSETDAFCNRCGKIKSVNTSKCVNCGIDIPDGASFCTHCGAARVAANITVNKKCRNCGHELDSKMSFCPICGQNAE